MSVADYKAQVALIDIAARRDFQAMMHEALNEIDLTDEEEPDIVPSGRSGMGPLRNR